MKMVMWSDLFGVLPDNKTYLLVCTALHKDIMPMKEFVIIGNSNTTQVSSNETQRRRHQKSKTGVPVAP